MSWANGAIIFCLFGEPGPSEPWGWQFFGHHLSLNCLVIGQQMALAPVFWGAEPAYADEGPFKGTRLFEDEERKGLSLMRALTPYQQRQATVAHSMVGGDLPPGRRHFADNLHLGGAYQDNRIIPYEGIRARDFTAEQRRRLVELAACYIAPHARGAGEGAHGGDRAPSRRHALLLDRRLRRGEPVLLPHPEPGRDDRVRPPRRRVPDQFGAGEIPRPHHRAHAQRQRLRHGPAAPPLRRTRRIIARGRGNARQEERTLPAHRRRGRLHHPRDREAALRRAVRAAHPNAAPRVPRPARSRRRPHQGDGRGRHRDAGLRARRRGHPGHRPGAGERARGALERPARRRRQEISGPHHRACGLCAARSRARRARARARRQEARA